MAEESSASTAHRILLVDDHEVFTQGLGLLLDLERDLEVSGWVTDGRAAVQAARRDKPAAVVMDLSLPGLNGVEATRQIVAEDPEIGVVCLSAHAEPCFVEEALAAGAGGYVVKEEAFEELVRAIRAVLAGRVYLCSTVTGSLVASWKAQRNPAAESAYALLTERERQVLQLIAEGQSSREIGERLCVSAKTVGTHREHIMRKTGLHTIAELTRYAVGEGLTDLSVNVRPEAAPKDG